MLHDREAHPGEPPDPGQRRPLLRGACVGEFFPPPVTALLLWTNGVGDERGRQQLRSAVPFPQLRRSQMSQFSSHLSRVLASAVVTAAAVGGNAAIAGCCAAGKCTPRQASARCGACSAKCGSAKAVKAKAASKSRCGAKCGAKCATAKCGAKSGGCSAAK